MTIKKFVLTATAVATVFAFTVPVSFASGCTTGGACPLDSVVTPNTATCNKCKMPMDSCKCKKHKKFLQRKKKCDPCTGAAAPCDKCKKIDCGCDPCKKDPCDPCKKSSCDKCKTGLGSTCMKEKTHANMQVYAYPGAVYSPANIAVAGQSENNNVISDSMAKQTCPRIPGVYIEDECTTGAAAPIIDEALLPPKSECCPDGYVQSPNSRTAIYKDMEPCTSSCNTGCSTGAACKIGGSYPDVSDNYWASADINRLTDQCVVVGYPDDLFKPNRPITRAEMAAMVVKGYNLEGTAMTECGEFKDVPRCHWAHDFINKGVSADILAGMPNDKFLPNNHISRTEALTILSKGIKCPMDNCKAEEILGKYRDGGQVPNWAKESVAKAIDNGALNDSQDCDVIRPNAKATRAEITTMLKNVRVAAGYDTAQNKTAIGPSLPTFVEKETPVCIPTLSLTMKDQINAKNANVGEMFQAETAHEITINGVTYPCKSRVNGRITEVIRPSKCNPGAIKLSFTEIVGCDGCKQLLPKQVLTAQIEKCKNDVNPIARLVEAPFTFVGSTLGNVGRTVGGALIGLSNATEGVFDQVGTGTGEIFQGQFKAAGRSYVDGIKTTVKAPIDITRTALVGTAGLFSNTVDEVAYLIDGSGNRIARVNPNEKLTIAFGNK